MQQVRSNWGSIGRILIQTVAFFMLFNLIYAAAWPRETWGKLSLYNTILPGRQRLPYGENPDESYNLSLNNVPAMMESHIIAHPQEDNEYRVVLLGDSSVWGWFLENEDTLAAYLNSAQLTVGERNVTFYNLGYPILSLTKDFLLLDAALAYDPDMIIWLLTLDSLPPQKQLIAPIVQHNPQRIQPLLNNYNLTMPVTDNQFIEPSFWQRTIIARRRPLANLLRLQLYGVTWSATGVDQVIPTDIPRRAVNLKNSVSWQQFDQPTTLTSADLSLDLLASAITHAGDVPVVVVNEPIFISNGANSDLRYNAWYPRWAYDQYRLLLADTATYHDWHYLDLWDAIPPDYFSDSPVHLTATGNKLLSQELQLTIRE